MIGHARFLAEPAYRRLNDLEPFLKRSIPVLIMVFLGVMFMARAMSLIADRQTAEQSARLHLSLLAGAGATAIEDARRNGFAPISGSDYESTLARALPAEATLSGRFALITDAGGSIIAERGADSSVIGKDLATLVDGATALSMLGQSAGVQPVQFDGADALAAASRIGDGDAVLMVIQQEKSIFAEWQKRVSLTVTLFAATSSILIVLLYAYFGQVSRTKVADDAYSEAHRRVETALARGRCGLWDWDLARGRIYWSRSMFELLGYEPLDDILSFGEVSELVHPEDLDLFQLANLAAAEKITGVDEVLRMRRANGDYVRVRLRTELAETDGTGNHLIGIAVDVTETFRLEAQSQEASQNLQAAIESTSESFALWDSDDRLVLCNRKYMEYHGLEEGSVKPGEKRSAILAAARKPVAERRIPQAEAAGGQTIERQIADGRWLQVNERRTNAGGMVSVSADITQLKLQEERLIDSERRLMASIEDLSVARKAQQDKAMQLEELNHRYLEAKDKAEAAYEAKSQFLANVSHELRTPLNAIIGFSDILRNGMLGPLGSQKYTEYANDIHSSGAFLLDVINDVLEMSKIEAGRLVLERQTMDLRPLIDEAVQMLSLQANEKNITVEQTIGNRMTVNGDRRSMKQILINLISNAVKFTPDGGHIRIRAKGVANAVQITIEDNGCGIPADALRRIARPFEQVQNQFSKNHKGSGLGLAITRSLAELHGGNMKIRSRVGHGTIVSIRIPCRDTLVDMTTEPHDTAPSDA